MLNCLNMREIHYFLIFGVVAACISLFQCYSYLMGKEEAGFLKAAYCRISFSQIFQGSLSIFGVIIHLVVWLAVSLVLYRIYMRYLHGRLP